MVTVKDALIILNLKEALKECGVEYTDEAVIKAGRDLGVVEMPPIRLECESIKDSIIKGYLKIEEGEKQ